MILLDPARSSDECCCFIGTTAAIIGAIGAATSAGATIYGAHKQSEASDKATAAQTQANEQALQFQREQAEYQAQQEEVNRRANYDQWAAKRRYQGSIGQMLGLGSSEVPAYVPGITPHFTGGPARGSFGQMVNAGPAMGAQAPPMASMMPRGPMPFGAAVAGGTPMPGAVPGVDPRLMAGNGGYVDPRRRLGSFGQMVA